MKLSQEYVRISKNLYLNNFRNQSSLSCQILIFQRNLASKQHKDNGKQLQKIDDNKKNKLRSAVVVDKVSVIPHPVSKLRLFSFAIPENETEYERKYREQRLKIQNFNHKYWSDINTSFNKKKKDYIENVLKANKPDIDLTSPQSHEELAQFYKKFLNDNHKKYIDYNFKWYRNNLSLLWPSFVVTIIRLRRRFIGIPSSSSSPTRIKPPKN